MSTSHISKKEKEKGRAKSFQKIETEIEPFKIRVRQLELTPNFINQKVFFNLDYFKTELIMLFIR